MREKVSIDELKDLISMNPSEKPDKASIVAGAVRTIKNLQQQVAHLEGRMPRPPVGCSCHGPCSCSRFEEAGTPSLLSGLSTAGVLFMAIDFKDFTIKQVNDVFETVSGFRKDELIGRRFGAAPLFGRYVHGEFPHDNFLRSSDPQQSLIPTASSEDYTPEDFQRTAEMLLHGGNCRVVCRWMRRDGYIVESFSTLCAWRAPGGLAIMNISTQEQRRFTIAPWLLSLPSLPSSFQVPQKGDNFNPLYVSQQS